MMMMVKLEKMPSIKVGPTALAREVMRSPPSVCPSVRPFVFTLSSKPIDR